LVAQLRATVLEEQVTQEAATLEQREHALPLRK
jgi:hypothetical protein